MRKLSFVAGIVSLTAIACTEPTSQLPTAPGTPAVVGIELTGPDSIVPGQSVQLLASIRLSDGTSKLPSSGTPMNWFSSNSTVLRVNQTGLATAGSQLGDARIFATYGTGSTQRQANKDFVVVPAGTYRLVGMVKDAEGPGFPLAGARVEATPGSVAATTDSAGQYRLYGVPANAVIQVSKNGYAPVSQAVQLSEHTTRDFQLVLSGMRVVVGGAYRLEIDATCSGTATLNADLRRRVYDVTVTQSGPLVEVLLTEPRFRLNSINRGNRFIGHADAGGVTFELEPYYQYYYPYYGPTAYPNVAERLPNGSFLVPEGTAKTSVSAAGVSGTMGALIYNYDSRFPASNSLPFGFCNSPAARFTMTPR